MIFITIKIIHFRGDETDISAKTAKHWTGVLQVSSNVQPVQRVHLSSVAVLADISVTSPRKLIVFIIVKTKSRKNIQKIF